MYFLGNRDSWSRHLEVKDELPLDLFNYLRADTIKHFSNLFLNESHKKSCLCDAKVGWRGQELYRFCWQREFSMYLWRSIPKDFEADFGKFHMTRLGEGIIVLFKILEVSFAEKMHCKIKVIDKGKTSLFRFIVNRYQMWGDWPRSEPTNWLPCDLKFPFVKHDQCVEPQNGVLNVNWRINKVIDLSGEQKG